MKLDEFKRAARRDPRPGLQSGTTELMHDEGASLRSKSRSRAKLRPIERSRPACYVDREGGAAELSISPETWDRMVATGELPKATIYLLGRYPRWRWMDVDAWLSSGKEHENVALDPFVEAVANGAKTQRRGSA